MYYKIDYFNKNKMSVGWHQNGSTTFLLLNISLILFSKVIALHHLFIYIQTNHRYRDYPPV